MGLSASNVNLLAFTARKGDIIGMQMKCSSDKMSLTRETQKITREYQEALNSKVLKWSNDCGVTYSDVSYNNLMRPGLTNQNKPYLITDTAGRVVIDSKYLEFAKLISDKGYDAVRGNIIQSLTGVNEDTLNQAEITHAKMFKLKQQLDTFDKRPDPNDIIEYPNLKKIGIEGLLQRIGDNESSFPSNRPSYNFSEESTWEEAYKRHDTIDVGAGFEDEDRDKVLFKEYCYKGIHDIANHLNDVLKEFFLDDETKRVLETSIEAIIGNQQLQIQGLIIDALEHDSSCIDIEEDTNSCFLAVSEFIDLIFNAFYERGGDYETINGDDSQDKELIWYDTEHADYERYVNDLNSWNTRYNALLNEYNETCSNLAQMFTDEQSQLIDFYDELFTSIEEKGWVYNYQITDTNYLNQMLLNNMYTITEVNREHFCKDKDGDSIVDHYDVNHYNTEVASNMKKVFIVNNENAILDAEIEYEYKKSLIKEKENRIDTRMATLQTELEAVNAMIKSIQTVEKDNIERTMSLFT